MSRLSSARRPQMSKKYVWLIAILLLVGVAFGASAVGRVLFAPWSIGLFGRDTLTGGWVGSLQARQGAEYGLYLDLEYKGRSSSNSGSRNYQTSNLKGRATLCAPTGERYEYEVLGEASFRGAIEDIWLEYGDPRLSALNLRLSGKWDAPELRLSTLTNPFLPDGSFLATRALSSDDPDDSFAPIVLTKGDPEELEPICQRIRR